MGEQWCISECIKGSCGFISGISLEKGVGWRGRRHKEKKKRALAGLGWAGPVNNHVTENITL